MLLCNIMQVIHIITYYIPNIYNIVQHTHVGSLPENLLVCVCLLLYFQLYLFCLAKKVVDPNA